MSTTAETVVQYPAQPLFVECSGPPPLLDQDQNPITAKTPPISDIKEEECILSDDDFYPDDPSDRSLSNRTVSDFAPAKVTDESAKTDPSKNPVPTFLVPVRDPRTKNIQNVLVPTEVLHESGMKIIKSILIPIWEKDGTLAYDIKKVVVPIAPEPNLPKRRAKTAAPAKEPKSKRSKTNKEEISSVKQSEDGSGKKKEEINVTEKLEVPETAETVEPKEEVDLILANLRTTCPICQKSFKSEQQMDKHVRREHKQPFRCKKCHYSYAKQEDLEKHAKIHEKDTYMKCPFCHLKYKRISGMRAHQIRVHSNVDPVCIRDRAKEGVASDSEEPKANVAATATKYVCQLCGNRYPQKLYLVAHKRIAHGIKKKKTRDYKCRTCKRCFTSEEGLANHRCNEQSFLCAECGKEFATNYSLLLHMRKHTGERPYQCKICQKAFHRSVSLRIHKITHTGERPYVCDLCGHSFTQRSSMMAHRKKHPGDHPPPPPLLLSRRKNNVDVEKE